MGKGVPTTREPGLDQEDNESCEHGEDKGGVPHRGNPDVALAQDGPVAAVCDTVVLVDVLWNEGGGIETRLRLHLGQRTGLGGLEGRMCLGFTNQL